MVLVRKYKVVRLGKRVVMGNKNSVEHTEDSRWMEHKFPGSGKVVLKWKKKYGFEGKFQTSELLKLQVDLKVDINKCSGRKKENKIKEYRISDEWLKESKRRDGERNKREQKKLQKANKKNALM